LKNKHMISTRHSITVAILLTLALIPTIIHTYIDNVDNDGRSVKNISTTLGAFISTPSKRNDQWGKSVFNSEDWFERIYQNKENTKVRLFIANSFDLKALYHHPELALSYAQNLSHKSISTLPKQAKIPVHVLKNDDDSILVAYVLMHNDTFIKDPIKYQLSESFRLLISQKKPMTLFYTSQTGFQGNLNLESSTTLLSLSIKEFRSQRKAI